MTEREAPRVLVEGGPFHRRVNWILAAIVGVLVGVLPVLGYTAVEAFHAAHDAHTAIVEVKSSRRSSVLLSCEEANERHKTAQAGLGALAAKTNPKHPTLAQAKARRRVLNAFVEALAPRYDCGKRVRELTRP